MTYDIEMIFVGDETATYYREIFICNGFIKHMYVQHPYIRSQEVKLLRGSSAMKIDRLYASQRR